VLEQGLLSQCPVYQLPMVAGALVTSFDLSRSNQMLAFGDTCGDSLFFCFFASCVITWAVEYFCTQNKRKICSWNIICTFLHSSFVLCGASSGTAIISFAIFYGANIT